LVFALLHLCLKIKNPAFNKKQFNKLVIALHSKHDVLFTRYYAFFIKETKQILGFFLDWSARPYVGHKNSWGSGKILPEYFFTNFGTFQIFDKTKKLQQLQQVISTIFNPMFALFLANYFHLKSFCLVAGCHWTSTAYFIFILRLLNKKTTSFFFIAKRKISKLTQSIKEANC